MQRVTNPQMFWHSLAIITTVIFALAATQVALHRFWQFETFYYDFGIYDQAIRRLAAFQPPIIEHYTVGGKIIWADHFHPGIVLLAPLYWLTDRSEGLLILQVFAVAATGLVIYVTSNKLLKRADFALAILLSFFFFAGTQNALITDFHEVTIMGLFLALSYWAAVNNHKKRLMLFFILMLSFKETFFLTGVGFAFFLWWFRPQWHKLAIALAAGATAYSLLAINIFIPKLSGGPYQYFESYDWRTIPQQLIYPWLKLKTVFFTFISFLGLPLLYLPTLPMILINFVPRFLSVAPSRWDLGMHYNAEIAPTLAISAAFGLMYLTKKLPNKVVTLIALLLVINAIFLHRFVLHGPLAMATHPGFIAHTQNFAFLEKLIDQVPNNASVMTLNNLAVRFTDGDVFLIRENYQDYAPDYIVLDMRAGQNPNNFYNVPQPESFLTKVSTDSAYLLEYQSGDQYVFRRKSTN